MKRIVTLILVLAFYISNAQDLAPGFKLWGSTGIDLRVSKKISISFSQLAALNVNPKEFQFTQGNLGMKFRFTKKFSTQVGYKPSRYFGSKGVKIYRRAYLDFSLKHKLFTLPIKHTITSEFHFPQLKKYRYRFIYTLKYYFKNKFLPLKMTPFIKGQLYYYLDGKPLSYYENKVLLVKQSPNDFHRIRIGAGIMMRPFKWLRATVYYTYQQEINTRFTTSRGLNVPSKNGSKIKDPFNNYHVVGLSLSFLIRTYKK